LNASFQKECVQPYELMDLTDAARQIGRWVEHYNHHRTHHGLGGLLVPAERFYGIAEQSLRRIEQGLGATTAELTSPENRALELFRVLSRGAGMLRGIGGGGVSRDKLESRKRLTRHEHPPRR